MSEQQDNDRVEPSMGASDANNGGGAGAGIPDAETAMRVGDPGHGADPRADRARLFPGRDEPPAKAGESDVPPGEQPAPKGM